MADERLRRLERDARQGGVAEREALDRALVQVGRPALVRVAHREALAVLDPELGLHVIRGNAFRFDRVSWFAVPAGWRGLEPAAIEARLRAILGALYAERAAQTSRVRLAPLAGPRAREETDGDPAGRRGGNDPSLPELCEGDPNVMELESFTWTLVEVQDAPAKELDGAFHLVDVDVRGGHRRVSWRDREGWLAKLRG